MSATTDDEGADPMGSSAGGGANAGGEAGPDSVNLMRLVSEVKKREEKGGGPADEELATDASGE